MSADLHDLVRAVKDLAIELGRSPRRYEFEQKIVGCHSALSRVGGYGAVLRAAGLASNVTKKIDNSIFERDIVSHLEDYRPRAEAQRKPYPTIAIISDIHWPFCNKRVIDAFISFVGDQKPEWVILNGDAWDMYSHTKFPRSHNVFTPREERAAARAANEAFWSAIKAASPKSKLTQLVGNHEIRPIKRILEEYPEAEDWIAEKLKEDLSFDGVTTIYDPREELLIGDIAVFHGYRTQLGAHRDYTLYNAIVGHTHKGGVVFRRIRGQTLWELNSGFAGDPEAKGLSYTPQKIMDYTPGFAYVDTLGPRFIPL